MSLALKYSRKYDDFEEGKRKVNLACAITLIVAFLIFVAMPNANAAFWNNQSIQGIVDLLEFSLGAPLYIVFGLLKGVDYNGYPDAGTKGLHSFYITIIGSGSYEMSSASFYDGFEKAINLIKSLAAFMIILLASAKILSNMEKGMDGQQACFKALMEIGMTGLCIMYLDKIMAGLAVIGTGLADSVLGGSINGTKDIGTIAQGIAIKFARPKYSSDLDGIIKSNNLNFVGGVKELIKQEGATALFSEGAGLGHVIGGYLKTAPSLITGVAAFVGAGLASIQTVLEMALRRITAPLAVTDIYQEGLRSPGARFLKRYFSTFIKLMIIAILAFAAPMIQTEIVDMAGSNPMIYSLLTAGINFSVIGMMFKCGEIANEVVGA